MSASSPSEIPPDMQPIRRALPLGQRNFTRVPRVVAALILREMTTTYGRNPGGYLWAILEPVAMIVILSMVFGIFLRSPSLGTNFLLFYASAVLSLRFYQQVASKIATAIGFNRPLLTYPRVTILDSLIARGILAVLTQLMVGAVVLAGIYATQELNEHIDYGPVLEGVALAILLAAGTGTLNAFLMVRFPVWVNIWGIVVRPLPLMSGLFYIYEDLPKIGQDILWFNPLMHVTGIVRSGVYDTYQPGYVSIPYLLAWSILPMLLGLLLLRRFGRDVLLR